MTCDFQGRGEHRNFKQRGFLLGAACFRALVSMMASWGTSPLYLFTQGKPSMPPPEPRPSKFPLLAVGLSAWTWEPCNAHF